MIKIKEINIISFGKIENLNIELNDGLNVIYGANEAGKSTVQAFIKAMFYGMGRKRKTDTLSDRVRYMPWNKNVMSGNLVIEYCDREIEIARRFGKTAAGDKISVTDKISGMVIDELNVSAPGEILFDMSAQMFEKTLWINQSGIYMGGADEEITAKLVNLTQTHNEEVSHIAALEKLKDKKSALKAESKRNKNGVIDDIDLRIDELANLKNRIIVKKNERKQFELVREKLIKKQETQQKSFEKAEKAIQTERSLEFVRKADKLREYMLDIKSIETSEDYIRFNDCNSEEIEETENLYIEKEALAVEISKYEVLESSITEENVLSNKSEISTFFIVSAILFIIGIIMMFVYMPLGIVSLLIAISLFIAVTVKKKNADNKTKKIQSIKSEYEEHITQLKSNLNSVNENLKEIFKKRRVDNISEYRAYYNKYLSLNVKLEAVKSAFNSLLGGEDYEKLMQQANEIRNSIKDVDLSELRSVDRDEIRHRMLSIERQLSDIDNKLAYEYSESINVADIEGETLGLEEKRKDAVLEYKALETAISGIEEAYLRLRCEFGPVLNRNVNDIVGFLTDGKYSDFRVSDMYRMKINCMGEAKEAEYLSMGTYEQIYLALRLSIAKLVADKNIIMFLDDAFSAYDDMRSNKAMELMKNYSENAQVILLSCHLRDKMCAEKLSRVNVVTI